jgi:hypothetical protein
LDPESPGPPCFARRNRQELRTTKRKNMPNYHVIKKQDKWEIIKEGAKKVSTYARTQKLAEGLAKRICKKAGGGEVRIHGIDGKIRDTDTVPPAKDPCPPRDRVY